MLTALYSPLFMQWKMKPVKNRFHFDFPVNLQEEFAGVVARVVTEPVEVSNRCEGG